MLIFFVTVLGTLVSAFSVFCFNEGDEGFFHVVHICLSNVVVALCQLATVIFLIGWIWSIIWGCAIVGHSGKMAFEIVKI